MIEVSHLSYRYGRKRPAVFENVSFSLEPGRIYGLLGKNGTGKSTLLYLLSGLLFPQEGSVKYRGLEMRERRPEALGDLYLFPETFRLPNMSLKNYVRLHAPFYPNYSEQLMHSSLEEFDLTPDVHLGQLSMGQQKKAYLSFALATNTSLLLMDEPSNGLDIPSKSQFRKVVADCMSDDRTIIISTHQVHDVEQLLDHILILSEREMLLNASVADIAEKYAFEVRTPSEMDDTVIYAEPSLQGNIAMTRRQEGQEETLVNIEILFNAVTKGLVK